MKLWNMSSQDHLYYKDRKDAGKQLGRFLESRFKDIGALVIGVPRGGMEIAWYVALQLKAELAVVVSKKLPLPEHPEYGIGAIAEQHSVYLSTEGETMLLPRQMRELIAQQDAEVRRRIQKYRRGKPLPPMKDRTVIVVDDGIATGVTLVPVIRLCRRNRAARIVIAAPVSGKRFDRNLYEADQIDVLFQPGDFRAVGQAYAHFDQVSDEQVMEILKKAEALNMHRYEK